MITFESDFAEAAYKREQQQNTQRTGTIYALATAGILALLIIQDIRMLGTPEAAWLKAAVMLVLLSFPFVRRACGDRRPQCTTVAHFVNLLALSLLANGMLIIVHSEHAFGTLPEGLESAAMLAVVVVFFVNFVFAEGVRNAYILHTSAPFFISLSVVLSLPGHEMEDTLEYTFASMAAIFFSAASYWKERQNRKYFNLRCQLDENLRYSNALYRLAPDAIIVHDAHGVIKDFNEQALRLTGMESSELFSHTIGDLLRENAQYGPATALCTTKNPSGTPVEISRGDIDLPDGPVTLVTLRDITERLKATEAVRGLSAALEQIPSSVVITDPQGRIRYVNRRFEELTGYSEDEARGQNPRILKSGHQDAEFYKNLWHTITAGNVWHGEFCNRTKANRFYWEAASIAPVFDDDGNIVSFVAVKDDITEKRKHQQEVHRLAMHDELTGLANRTQLSEAFYKQVGEARRHDDGIAVLYLDLDKFKPVNDRLGHSVGDEVLQVLAQRLQTLLRPTDLAGRIGGDEFLVILRAFATTDDVKQVAQRIVDAAAEPITTSAETVSVGVSVGMAVFPEHGEDFHSLLHAADNAMYSAKYSRNRRHDSSFSDTAGRSPEHSRSPEHI